MSFITVGKENSSDIQIHYTDRGNGEPLVLIHGYPFSGAAWEKIEAQFLDDGYRVITYDRRGFGQSSKPSYGYEWDTFASDLDKILSNLNLTGVTLVGHSMGTGEVTRYLANYGSERISRAVFVSPIPPFLLKAEDNENGIDQEVFDRFKEAIKKDRYEFTTEFFKNFYNLDKLIGKPQISEEKLKADFMIAAQSSPIAFLDCVGTWTEDFRQDLESISVPSLIIQGDADKILPLDVTGKLLADAISSKLKVITGGSHGIPWTHAVEIFQYVRDFMSSTPSRRPERQVPETRLSQ